MAKVDLADHMRERRTETGEELGNAGPFVTISRQYGCHGFSLGLLLLEILNEDAEPDRVWRIYHREILESLAAETDTAAELLQKERRARPRPLVDFFRSLGRKRPPSGYEIRSRMSTIIRDLAIQGYAIIIGQGGAWAVQDLPNGLSVRLEAPEEWRVKQIAFREGLGETEALLRVRAEEQEREYLSKVYKSRAQRMPAFHLVYDCSVFTLAHIARQIVLALRLKGCLG